MVIELERVSINGVSRECEIVMEREKVKKSWNCDILMERESEEIVRKLRHGNLNVGRNALGVG